MGKVFDLRDPLVQEAAVEVDALLPGTPRISPPPPREPRPGEFVEVRSRRGWRYLPHTDQYIRDSDGFRVTREHVHAFGWPTT